MSGFGGAGAFSDGKYNITNDFGGTLYEHIGRKEAIDLMEYVDAINVSHGGEKTKMYSTAADRNSKSFASRTSFVSWTLLSAIWVQISTILFLRTCMQ